MPERSENIAEGDHVILQKGDFLKSFRINSSRLYTFGTNEAQFTLDLHGIVGNPFGSSFKMVHVKEKLHKLELLQNPAEFMAADNGDDYQQNLVDEDIFQGNDYDIKFEVIGNDDMNEENKNILQRKTKIIALCRPSLRLVANMLYSHNPLSILNLRIDSLSQLLCQANIYPGGQFVLFESGTKGLVTAAMLQQIGEDGNLVVVYHKTEPQREVMDLLNFTPKHLEALSCIEVGKLPETSQDKGIEIHAETTSEKQTNHNNKEDHRNQEELLASTMQGNDDNKVMEMETAHKILEEGVCGVVVACHHYPANITLALLQYLKPGNPFAVFSPYREPLLEMFYKLKNYGTANVRIYETWLRHYQVLPENTHPENIMSGGGGFVMAGSKILNS